jgi:hypothetical protein
MHFENVFLSLMGRSGGQNHFIFKAFIFWEKVKSRWHLKTSGLLNLMSAPLI